MTILAYKRLALELVSQRDAFFEELPEERALGRYLTRARDARINVFAGTLQTKLAWVELFMGFDPAVRVRVLTLYFKKLLGEKNDLRPEFLDPRYISGFEHMIDADGVTRDGQPIIDYDKFLKRQGWIEVPYNNSDIATLCHAGTLTETEKRTLLARLGSIHEVNFDDGRRTLCVMLKAADTAEFLGYADIADVFKTYNAKVREYNASAQPENQMIEVWEGSQLQNGYIADMNLYQQVLLLEAIVARDPRLEDVLGFYNLNASSKVYQKLASESSDNTWWIWTAEQSFNGKNNSSDYPADALLRLKSAEALKGRCFASRGIAYNGWNDGSPGSHNVRGGVAFGTHF